jgi:S-adenosylmethionine:tRNA ribosyltransferase-isomerase
MSHLLSDYNFTLPEERIAQAPLAERDSSRLLVVGRHSNQRSHHKFRDVVELLPLGAVLVLNNTKVIPARLFGRKPSGAAIEILLLRQEARPSPQQEVWRSLMRAKGLQRDARVILDEENEVFATILDDNPKGEGVPIRRVRIEAKEGVAKAIERLGQMPLPPYIQRGVAKEEDKERYQTVFAKEEGSSAAPTAGLHFTDALLAALREKGVAIEYVTLHVGPGTFLPVKEEDTSRHKMHEEHFEISQETARVINQAKADGRPIIAVGTTVVRTLESAVDEEGGLRAMSGETSLFIRPGFTFRIVSQLITNFHLPKSTLLMLVCAFGGHSEVLAAYQEAIDERYRFFSYGDAMLLQ